MAPLGLIHIARPYETGCIAPIWKVNINRLKLSLSFIAMNEEKTKWTKSSLCHPPFSGYKANHSLSSLLA